MRSKMISCFMVVSMLMASAASAGDYAFRLFNDANGYVIDGFYTLQNGRWSDNWLDYQVASGDSVSMDWYSDEGACIVPFKVSWVDFGQEEFTIDWCQNVKNIYMEDVGFTWN
jgi:hypothetical protein